MNKMKEKSPAATKLAPVLMVNDVAATVRFYEDVLGFKKTANVPENEPYVFAMVEAGGVEIQFQEKKSMEEMPVFKGRTPGGSLVLYMDTPDVGALYERVKDHAAIAKAMHKTFYGTREFYMLDCNGYVLGFAEK